mmetsp:Transcript_7838/g.22681  ORF Transcript_7838/g.22681 Transcript_7838/m.22681 type:complete len:97 (+) Transcript_7838:61-351(+)
MYVLNWRIVDIDDEETSCRPSVAGEVLFIHPTNTTTAGSADLDEIRLDDWHTIGNTLFNPSKLYVHTMCVFLRWWLPSYIIPHNPKNGIRSGRFDS